MKGIDLSQYNKVTDWNAVKNDGVEFALLKITKGSNRVEPKFEEHYQGCLYNGIRIGAYKYVYARSLKMAEAEANAIVQVLNGRDLPYGVWLDMEDSSIKGLGKATLTAIIDKEAQIIRAAGYPVGIYCNKDWYKNVLDTADLPRRYLFWVAGYGKNTGLLNWASFFSYKSLFNAILWQYTSKGVVKGIDGVVDINCNLIGDPEAIINTYGK